jgi:hypothetical protein
LIYSMHKNDGSCRCMPVSPLLDNVIIPTHTKLYAPTKIFLCACMSWWAFYLKLQFLALNLNYISKYWLLWFFLHTYDQKMCTTKLTCCFFLYFFYLFRAYLKHFHFFNWIGLHVANTGQTLIAYYSNIGAMMVLIADLSSLISDL